MPTQTEQQPLRTSRYACFVFFVFRLYFFGLGNAALNAGESSSMTRDPALINFVCSREESSNMARIRLGYDLFCRGCRAKDFCRTYWMVRSHQDLFRTLAKGSEEGRRRRRKSWMSCHRF